ncbi:MAG: preprotein translocase subunit SecE [Myxococcota bacterium]
MATKTKDKGKPKKPKGKPLSQQLQEKESARAAYELADDDDDASPEETATSSRDIDDEDGDDAAGTDERDQGGSEDADDDDAEERDDDAEEEGDDDEDAEEGDDEDAEEGDDEDAEEGDDEEDDEELAAAAQMGVQRFVMAGFFGFWIVVSYILGRAIEGLWAEAATRQWTLENAAWLASVEDEGTLLSRANLALVFGFIIGGAIVMRYYRDPDTRTYADEVAEQISKVKWPTRKQVGNNTVVVIISTAILTAYLTLLDQFWSFVTNLIYS